MAQHYNCSIYPEIEGITFTLKIFYLLLSFCILGCFHTVHFKKFNLTFKKKMFNPFAFTVITDILGIYFYHLILLSMDPFSCCFSIFYLFFFSFFFRKISSTLPFTCSLKLHFCYYIIKFSKLFLCKCSIFLFSKCELFLLLLSNHLMIVLWW